MIKNFILSSINKTLNTYLALNPQVKSKMEKLQNKSFKVELLPQPIIFFCTFKTDSIVVTTDETIIPDLTLSATPLQLLNVIKNKNNRQQLFSQHIQMQGDAVLGEQIMDLFDSLEVDWEEHFSSLVGDIPAYHTGQFFHKFKSWLKNTDESFSHNIKEYLQEEALYLPTREALQDFFSDIDTLRMDLDRLDARMKNLSLKLRNEETQ